MATHAKLSPSAAHRWMNCPGSVNLIGDERQEGGEAAMRGTAAHKIIETMLAKGADDAHDFMGRIILVHAPGVEETMILNEGDKDISGYGDGWHMFVADEKMIDGVQIMIDAVEAARSQLNEPVLYTERFLDMTWLDDRLGGTADVTLVEDFGWIHLLDYKNGYVYVDHRDNEQLKNYGVGLLHEHPDAEGVRITVVQPNARAEEYVRTVEYTRDELKLFEIQLKEAAEATSKPNAHLRAGPWCGYCPAKTRCKEFERSIAAEAAADFGFTSPEGMVARINERGPKPTAVKLEVSVEDAAALARKATWVPLIDKWCREVEGAVQTALLNGNAVPGFKLVQGRANRKWRPDANLELAISNAKVGINLTELWTEPELKSPAQVEKLGTKEQRKLLKAIVAEQSTKPPGKLTVAEDADPRPAISPDDAAKADFANEPIEGDEP